MKERAKDFAKKAHKGQLRKNTNTPYIAHPIRVAERLEHAGFTDEVVCAGYLHDVVEDTPYEIEDITKAFGTKVAQLVAAHTEDKSKSWQERKQHTIETVKTAGKEVKYLIVADKLDNLLDLESSLKQQGEIVWESFNAGKEKQKWYNTSIVLHMYTQLDQTDVPDFFKEFKDAVIRVFE